MSKTIPRYFLVLLLGFWLGGLTFYTLVVIPSGEDVVGGTTQGFVTQEVTGYLNWIGMLVVVALLWNAVERRQRTLIGAWVTMAVCQVVLFVLHPKLDRLLDVRTHEVIDPDTFFQFHTAYLAATTVQWLGGMVYVWFLVTRPASSDCPVALNENG